MKTKLSELVGLYDNICQLSACRSRDLEDTLEVSEKFWEDYNNLCSTVRDLQDQITSQDPPALEPAIIREQQDLLEVTHHSLNIHVHVVALILSNILIFLENYNCGKR